MAEQFLLPEDVGAADAQQVLDFINQAASAQLIAEAVEFPDELDVGVRISQRIIDRRTQLNGFKTLDQLYAVPSIGPGRFTEIVVSLSSARPPRDTGSGVTPSELADLRRSIEALRAMLPPAVQARLWSVQETIWLGQNATLLVQLNDADGRPLIDQPMTITTSWGELTTLNGVDIVVGNVVTARTNDVGLAQLRLGPRFQAPLSDAERLAFEVAAGRLPLTAPWPTAASVQLTDLVQLYRAPGSDDLRESVDAAFREYGASLEQAEHRGEALAQWKQVPVSIVCFVHDEAEERGQRNLAIASHTLIVRNWLPAFLATFEADVSVDPALSKELQRAPGDAADASTFLNDVFISVQSYLNTERGELGQTIRNRAAQQQLQQFLQTSVASLPTDVRVEALGGVRDASNTIGKGGLTVFTAVDATRRDSKTKLDLTAGVFGTRLSSLERTAVTAQQLDDVRGQILQQSRADMTLAVSDARTAQQTQFLSLVADSEGRLAQRIDQKADRSAVDTLVASNATFEQALGLKADRSAVDALTASDATLKQAIDLKADRTSVDALAASNATLRRDVDSKADRATVDVLATSTATLRRDLDSVSATTTGLRTDVNGLSTSVSGLNTRVTTGLTSLGSRVDVIDARVRTRPSP